MLLNKRKMDESEQEMNSVPQGAWHEVWYTLVQNKRAMLGLVVIVLLFLTAIFADYIAPYGMREQNLSNTLQSPNTQHWFGTDDLGRDVLSRLIYGTRVSLIVGVSSVAVSLTIGGVLGVLAGYYKGKLDTLIMRFCDILLSIPSILLAIAIVASLGSSIRNMIIAIGVASIPIFARIIRAGVISVTETQYIEAGRALGANDVRLIFKHIIPNILSPIIVQASLEIAAAILSAAGLGFIGLGLEASVADWGTMLSSGRGYIRQHFYLTLFPGAAIMLTILAFNLFGDGLRDAFDPKMRER